MDVPPDSTQNGFFGPDQTQAPIYEEIRDAGYLRPYQSESQYAELSETFVKRPVSQQVDPSQHAPLDPTPHLNGYITPVFEPEKRHSCKLALNLSVKLFLSVLLNIFLIAGLVLFLHKSCVFDNCSEDFPLTNVVPTAAPSIRGLDGTELCLFTKHVECEGGLLRKTHGGVRSFSSRNSSTENRFQTEFPSMCCYYQSQPIQKLAHLFLLVKSHNKVRKVASHNPHMLRTSDMSIACKMAVSPDRGLHLYDNRDINCNGSIHVKRTRMHLLYLYLAINCSVHGTGVVRAGVKSENKVVAEKEMNCDKKVGNMTLSVFSFKNLTQGTILVPFVSHTNCVTNDKDSNRFEILTL